MRILLISHNFQLEGAPLNLLRIARGLQDRGHTCYLASPMKGPLTAYAKEWGVTTRVLPHCYNAESAVLATRYIEHIQPDCVLVNTVLAGTLLQELRTSFPTLPLVFSIHESEIHELARDRSDISPEIFQLASATLFVSEETKKSYQKFIGDNTYTVYNSVDTDLVDEWKQHHNKEESRKVLGIPLDATLISSIGTICPRKGQRELVTAFTRVFEQLDSNHNVHLMLVGKVWRGAESYLREALAPAEHAEVMNRVHVLQPREDVYPLYSATDIFVLNAFIESLPIVVLEAMAFSLPVVGSKAYGMKEQIIHNQTGLTYLPGNMGQLTEALIDLITNSDKRDTLGKAGRKHVEQNFTHTQMIDGYEGLFSDLVTDESTVS